MQRKIEGWLVLLASFVTIGVNGLANSLPINDQTTGKISDRFDVLFVPAGYVFSIWGLIYLGLLAFSIYQVLPKQIENPRLCSIRWPYVLASLANTAWLLCWHYNLYGLSMLAMLILLMSLIWIYVGLGIGRARVAGGERWFARLPFSVYLGWISVATIANATVVLTFYEWGAWGLSAEFWTVIMLSVGVILSFSMNLTRGDIAYALVLLWAYVGIAVKHGEIPFSQLAWALTAILFVFSGIGWLLKSKRPGGGVKAKVGTKSSPTNAME